MICPDEGFSFEVALRRWSPPERYAALIALKTSDDFRIKGEAERVRAHRRAREELEDLLFERLRGGEVLSSADNPLDDPDRPRVLIDPGVYEDRSLSYNPVGECVEGSSFQLSNVKVFSLNRVPVGLEDAPFWSPPSLVSSRVTADVGTSLRGLSMFRHDATYEHVWIGDQEFALTGLQARIVCELHRAAVAGQPWMHLEALRDATEFDSAKLSHLFRRMPNWQALIRSDMRGNYRQNV